jgi:hypothetical protein
MKSKKLINLTKQKENEMENKYKYIAVYTDRGEAWEKEEVDA